ncbi:MAG: MFS transporter, partial [Actinobacteria bacterium]|nr:MFS transporter [Actinomycetota bacterium]
QTTYKRDRVFWLVSFQTGIYGYFMGGFGPALPLLQADQGVSGAIAGLHGTALGVSSILAGALNSRIVHRFGRYRSAWLGIALFLIGATAFVILPDPAQTIPAAFIIGMGISIAIANTVTYLAGHYRSQAKRAVSQNNAVTSAFNLIGTITIGLIASTTFSWRIGLLACIPFAAILYLASGRKHKPEHQPNDDGHQKGSLPLSYWLAWLGLFASIAAEFAIIFWSAALIRERTFVSPALATTLVLAFPLGMFLGRWFGTNFFPNVSIDQRLKGFITLQIIGFFIFWTSEIVITSFIALLMVGLGTSIQFTLTTLRLLNLGRPKTDLAMGRSSFAAGIAIAGSPLLLGALADQLGITQAFLIVPAFMALALLIIYLVPVKESIDEL